MATQKLPWKRVADGRTLDLFSLYYLKYHNILNMLTVNWGQHIRPEGGGAATISLFMIHPGS